MFYFTLNRWLFLVGYCTILLVALTRSDFASTFDFFRDIAPFIYLFIFFATLSTLHFSQTLSKERILKLLTSALIIHQVWFSLATFFPTFFENLPFISGSRDVRWFAIRPDYDMAVSSILVGLMLFRVIRGQRLRISVSILLLSIFTILNHTSRAGLLALILSILLVIYTKLSPEFMVSRDRFLLVLTRFLGLFIVATLFLFSLNSDLIQKTWNTFTVFNGGSQTTETQNLGGGTTSARLVSWLSLIRIILNSPDVLFFGSGFGQNYLFNSGVSTLLLGSQSKDLEYARSPHNFLLSVFVRIGIIGLLLIVLMLSRILIRCLRLLRSNEVSEYTVVIALSPICLVSVSILGVVLESPFGAAPFYFLSALAYYEGRPKSQ